MRKSACCMLAIILALLLALPSAVAAECNHEWVDSGSNTWQHELVESNEDGHVYKVFYREVCIKCGLLRATAMSEGGFAPYTEPHNYVFLRVGEHGSDGYHEHIYVCTICGRNTIRTIPCSGPPCVNAMRKIPAEPEMPEEVE